MRVTIKTIAEMAGVSKATVSRVINNSKPVSDEVRQRVMKVIEETQFQPSSVARSLSSQSTKLVGVLIPDVSNPVFSKVIHGIEECAKAAGYNILLCNSRYEHTEELTYLDILREKEVDGLIISGFHTSEDLVEKLKAFPKPVVIIGYDDPVIDFPRVVIDNYQAAYDAGTYLCELGHTDIGFIHGPLNDFSAGKLRFDGFVTSLADHQVVIDQGHMESGGFKIHDGYSAAKALMMKNPNLTAIFCANDEMAIGAMKAIYDSGKKIPDDIAVVGFDDIDLASIYYPSLTTVRQPFIEKGEAAMKVLLGLVDGQEVNIKTVFPHKLIERQSTIKPM